jgi:hypothetical protein
MTQAEIFLRQQQQQNNTVTSADNAVTMTQAEMYLSNQNKSKDGLVQYATEPKYRSKVNEGAGIALFGSPDDPMGEDSSLGTVASNIGEGVVNFGRGAMGGTNEFIGDVGNLVTPDGLGGNDFEAYMDEGAGYWREDIPKNSVGGALGDEIAQLYLGGKAGELALKGAGLAVNAGKDVYKKLRPSVTDEVLNGYQPSVYLPNDLKPNRYTVHGESPKHATKSVDKAKKVIERDIKNQTRLPSVGQNRISTSLDGEAVSMFDKQAQIARAKNAPHSTSDDVKQALLDIENNYVKSPEAIALENVIQKRNHEGVDVDPRWFNKNFDKSDVRKPAFFDSYLMKRLLHAGESKQSIGDELMKLSATKDMTRYAKTKAGKKTDYDAIREADRQGSLLEQKIKETVALQQGALPETARNALTASAGVLGSSVLGAPFASIALAPAAIKQAKGFASRVGRNAELKRLAVEAGVPSNRVSPYLIPSDVSRAIKGAKNVADDVLSYSIPYSPNISAFLPANSSFVNTGVLGLNENNLNNMEDVYNQFTGSKAVSNDTQGDNTKRISF